MLKIYLVFIFLLISKLGFAQKVILNQETKEPISFATVSFGNGNGVFADEQGLFKFTKKLYPDIDSLYISALGFKELGISTKKMADALYLEPKSDELKEVLVVAEPKGPFKLKKIKPLGHDNYHHCWLPTIESEIAVFHPNPDTKTKKITKVFLPIKVEISNKKKKKLSKGNSLASSTLFKMHFYENDNGNPGKPITYEEMVFLVTKLDDKFFELNISEEAIYMPKNGLFISIQVLGYTDKNGKLLPNKKYREVKTSKGIVKVSTTFRPLLPFTDKMENKRTFVKRVFLSNNRWVLFDKKNIQNTSNLLKSGMNNYGMGLELKVYKND